MHRSVPRRAPSAAHRAIPGAGSQLFLLFLLLLPLTSAAPGRAQQVPDPALGPGWTSSPTWTETNLARSVLGFAVAADAAPGGGDSVFVAVSDWIERIDPGAAPVVVHRFPNGSTAGALHWYRPDAASVRGTLLFTQFAPPRLHGLDLDAPTGTAPWSAPMPGNAFDLAVSPDGRMVLASANPSWPAPGAANGLWLVDPTGATAPREVLRVRGPSGPLAFMPDGDLLYAVQSDQYPTPQGAVRIVRFPRAVLDRVAAPGAPAGSLVDAVPFATGLDGAYDLAVDDRGVVHVSDPTTGSVLRIDRTGARRPMLLAGGPQGSALQLQWRPRTGSARTRAFEPFQPTDGNGALLVLTSNYSTHTALHAVGPARPGLAGGRSASTVSFVARGLPPHAPAWVGVAATRPVTEQPVLWIDGIPLLLGVSPFGLVLLPAPASGPQGTTRLDVPVPPGARLDGAAFVLTTMTSSRSGATALATSPAIPLRL